MPQPALHMLLADATLRHWPRRPRRAPFSARSADASNAFLLGALGPDFGLFPGGIAELSVIAHAGRSGELVRALFRRAGTEAQRAFAWGWLSHVLADVAIHPLVNRAAADRVEPDAPRLADHVRIEVGLDAWYAWRHPVLRRLRLRPAVDSAALSFLSQALHDTHGFHVTAGQLSRMQRGALHFTHLALHFATTAARELCWDETDCPAGAPAGTALAWRLVSALSARGSIVHAYLNPTRPDPWLRARLDVVMHGFNRAMDEWVRSGVERLPDYNLEDGSIPETAPPAVWLSSGSDAGRVA